MGGLRIDDDAGHRRLYLKELEFASDSAGNVTARISKAPTVATTHVCELGEHCRCKSYDVAYQQDCWNWIGVIL